MPPAKKLERDLTDEQLVELQYGQIAAGLSETMKFIKALDEEITRLKNLGDNVVPIAVGRLQAARKQLGAVLERAMGIAKALGIDAQGVITLSGDTDIGAFTMPKGAKGSIDPLDFVPGATFMSMGRKIGGKALVKLGLRKAITQGARFARFSRGKVAAAGNIVKKVGGKFAGPGAELATTVIMWFAAASAFNVAAPGFAGILETLAVPLIVVGVAWVFFNRRN